MLSILSRFFKTKSTPSPQVVEILETALAQRAVCQIDLGRDAQGGSKKYLFPVELDARELTLESHEAFFIQPSQWEGGKFTFKCIIQARHASQATLYKFTAKILRVEERGRRIRVALPEEIIKLERRQNVRIRLQQRHMPDLTIWAIGGGAESGGPPKVVSSPIIEIKNDCGDIGLVLKNISGGGMRLSLKRSEYQPRKDDLAVGRRVLIQLVFGGRSFSKVYKFLLIARVRNVLDGDRQARVDLGAQFVARHNPGASPAWTETLDTGVEELNRLVHILQIEYYKEIKRKLENAASRRGE